MYKKYFWITIKAGWDCLRHYEILMNGCIPYFRPKRLSNDCITTLPKLIEFLTKFEKILNLYNQFKILKKTFNVKKNFFTNFIKIRQRKINRFLNKNEIIFNIKDNLLDFTKEFNY